MIKRSYTVSIPDIHGGTANARGVDPGFEWSRPTKSRQQKIILRQARKKKTSLPVFLFLISLAVPWVIPVGTLRMSVYRIVLVVMVLPCLGMLVAGKAGRIRIADIALLLYWFWCMLSFIVVNGLASTAQSSGILFVETIGTYLLARCYVRDADDFYNMVQLLFRIVACLLPFAIIECVTGQNILRKFFGELASTQPDPVEAGRWGLSRVYSVFDHPILFGVWTGSIFALAYLVLGYRKNFFQRALSAGVVGATTFLSLSAGPIIAMVLQVLLLSWDWLFGAIRMRWKILVTISIFTYVFFNQVLNRSPIEFFGSRFVFGGDSYWVRQMIWEAGSAAALNHPLYGVGMDSWERPGTMPPSIDNYWLSIAVQHGFPAVSLILLTIFLIFLPLSFKKGLDDKLTAYRTGYLITIVGFVIVGGTVAFWDAAYVLFIFFLGSGAWILDVGAGRRPRNN
jgi:hypothetical protein